jgi:hypothetical protein
MAVFCDVIGDAIGEVGGYARYAMDEGLGEVFFISWVFVEGIVFVGSMLASRKVDELGYEHLRRPGTSAGDGGASRGQILACYASTCRIIPQYFGCYYASRTCHLGRL